MASQTLGIFFQPDPRLPGTVRFQRKLFNLQFIGKAYNRKSKLTASWQQTILIVQVLVSSFGTISTDEDVKVAFT